MSRSSSSRLVLDVVRNEVRTRVAVDVPLQATAAEVWRAVAEVIGAAPAPVSIGRLGSVPDSTPFADLGLVVGDSIFFDGGWRRVGDALPEGPQLEIIAGHDAGKRIALRPGANIVGRDHSCHVVVDDSTVGRRHAQLDVGVGDQVTVADLGSANGTFVNGSAVAEKTRVGELDILEIGQTLFTVRPAPRRHPILQPSSDGTLEYNRPPILAAEDSIATFMIEVPEREGARPNVQLGAVILPVIMGVVFWQLFGQAYMLLFTLLSPAIVLWNRGSERRTAHGRRKGDEAAFRSDLRAVVDDVRSAWIEDLKRAHREHAPPAVLLESAQRVGRPLWSKATGAASDPPEVRIGCADQPSRLVFEIQDGAPELVAEAEAALSAFRTMRQVPHVVPLEGVVGVVGSRRHALGVVRWWMIQLAATYSPADLRLAVMLDEDSAGPLDEVSWLPHTQLEAGVATSSLLAATPRAVADLIAALTHRVRRDDAGTKGKATGPRIVVFVDGWARFDRSQLSELLPATGGPVTVVTCAARTSDLPKETGHIVELIGPDQFVSHDLASGGSAVTGVLDVVGEALQGELARAVAPVRDIASAGTRSLPSMIRWIELAGFGSEHSALVDTWRQASGDGLPALIGQAAEGAFEVDIERDGPHGLIGGTTGSGKSELLQTLILALAMRFSPRRINFLLIDYKGGTAFGACARLPHSAGLITDLDPSLSKRALVTLNAELRRRERLLAEAGCADLAELRRRDSNRAPASLLIVIDEFATLKAELGEFVDGVVDIARRGRSLGMHLILATQSPDEAISSSIQDNTNWRIALRVVNRTASEKIIASPTAADLTVAGRAIYQSPHGHLTTFQSAYVGSRVGDATNAEVKVTRLRFGEQRHGVEGVRVQTGPSDLERLVDTARAAASAGGYAPPDPVWLPPLQPVVGLSSLNQSQGAVSVGVIDRPEQQRQDTFTIEFRESPLLLVYGGPGMGKTTFLTTFACSASSDADVEPMWLYGLSGTGASLDPIAPLPSVGAVVSAGDPDLTIRLIAMLEAMGQQRRDILQQEGVARIDDLAIRLPRIVVLIDDYRGVASALERVDHGAHLDRLQRLASTGPSIGIHLVITAARRSDLPGTVAGLVRDVITLAMPSADEYAQLGISPHGVPGDMPPGRALFGGTDVVQIAVPGEEPGGVGLRAAVAEQVRRATQGAVTMTGGPPPTLAVLGREIAYALLPSAQSVGWLPIGLGEDLEPVAVDLADHGFLVVGPPRSGRSTALATMSAQLERTLPDAERWLLAPRRSQLTGFAWNHVAEGPDKCDAAIAALSERLDSSSVILVVDDGEELADAANGRQLEALVRRARDAGLFVVAAAEVQSAQRAFASFISELRKSRSGVLLQPDVDVDGDIFSMRLPRTTRREFPPGRGYVVQRGTATLLQVATRQLG